MRASPTQPQEDVYPVTGRSSCDPDKIRPSRQPLDVFTPCDFKNTPRRVCTERFLVSSLSFGLANPLMNVLANSYARRPSMFHEPCSANRVDVVACRDLLPI